MSNKHTFPLVSDFMITKYIGPNTTLVHISSSVLTDNKNKKMQKKHLSTPFSNAGWLFLGWVNNVVHKWHKMVNMCGMFLAAFSQSKTTLQ